MIKYVLKIAWRNVKNFWLYNTINIIGLSIAISVGFVVVGIYQNEQSYDQFHKNGKSIYRIIENLHYQGSSFQQSASSSFPIAYFLKNQNNEIKQTTRVFSATLPSLYPSLRLIKNENVFDLNDALCVDSNFFKVFSFGLLCGKKDDLFQQQSTILLSKKYAIKLFQNPDSALNKLIQLRYRDTLIEAKVVGVFNDFPSKSHLQTNALVTFPRGFDTSDIGRDWSVLLGSTYLLLSKDENIVDLEKKYSKEVHAENQYIDLELQPLKDIHTKSYDYVYDSLNFQKTNQRNLNFYLISALILLVIACGNFININFALLTYRGKEIAIKKIIGASKAHLTYQFYLENIIVISISIFFGLILTILMFPWIESLLGLSMDYSTLFNIHFILIIMSLMIILWLLVSMYPAFIFSSIKVINVIKNKNLVGISRNNLMNFLIVIQFSFSFILIVSIIVIHKQNSLLLKSDVGFNYNRVLNLPMDQTLDSSKLNYLMSRLKQIPSIDDISFSKRRIGDGSGLFGVSFKDEKGESHDETALTYFVSPNFLKFFKIQFSQGNNFNYNGKNQYIVNQEMMKKLGWTNSFGKNINLSWLPPGNVVGVVKDFHFASFHDKLQPLLICPITDPSDIQNIYIKLKTPTLSSTQTTQLMTIWKSIFNEQPRIEYLDDLLKSSYKGEKKLSNILFLASCLAIFVSAIGLFGMSIFTSRRRTKEVSVRKVLGARTAELILGLSIGYLKPIAIAIVISTPISIYMLYKWLENYPYRINLSYLYFITTSLLLIFLSFISIFYQVFKVSKVNPVKYLKE